MKKIGITSKGKDLDSLVSPAPGACQYICIVEWDNGQIINYKTIVNPSTNKGCIGVVAMQNIAKEGIEALLTGNIGAGSFNYLENQGINVYQVNNLGKVKDAVIDYFNNNLPQLNNPNSPGKGNGQNRSKGRGLGRGQGRGLGKGPGQGRNKP